MNLISKSPLSDDKNLIIDEDYVYKTTGSVSPYIINNVKNILLTMSMNDAFTSILLLFNLKRNIRYSKINGTFSPNNNKRIKHFYNL